MSQRARPFAPAQPAPDAGELLGVLSAMDTLLLRLSRGGRASPVGALAEAFCESASGDERPIDRLVAPTHLRDLEAVVQRVRADGKSRSLSHPGGVGPGQRRYFRTTAVRSGSDDVLLAAQEITQAEAEAQQWHQIEAWLATLSEALPFDFWICGLDGRLLLQNAAAQQHQGGLAVGSMLEDLPADEALRAERRRALGQALQGKPAAQLVHFVDGSGARYVEHMAHPILDGEVVRGVIGLEMDVTEQRQTERLLRESLEHLKEAQQALVRNERLTALGEMAAVVAHEVRNPLGAIANATSLLTRRVAADVDSTELTGIIDEEVHRLERIVAGLLDFVRPLTASVSPVPLAPLVERALVNALRGEPERITVRRGAGLETASAPADSHLLGLALTNVLRNAVQAIPHQGEIFVDAAMGEHSCQIVIRDTGEGVSRRVMDRLFQPFVTSRPTGSGLGLAIVKRVLAEHRGDVTLANSPGGVGTTCVLTLPLRPEEEP